MKSKKFLFLTFLILVFFCVNTTAFAAPIAQRNWEALTDANGNLLPNATGAAQSAVLIDVKTNAVLVDKNMNVQMYPASITKIMTALIVLEHKELTDPITYTRDVRDIIRTLEDDTKFCDLKYRETMTVEHALYGLLLESGADSAIVLALAVGGTYENFVNMMNQKAQELNMTNTHFMNPHGLDDEKHYSTAYDMALLAIEAMKNQRFAQIVTTASYTPEDNEGNRYSDNNIIWRNTNLLVTDDDAYGYDYAAGVKTGYTSMAGSTLVSAAIKDNQSLISVIMHDDEDTVFVNTITLFEYGFNLYDTIELSSYVSSQTKQLEVTNADTPSTKAMLNVYIKANDIKYMTIKRDFSDGLTDGYQSFGEKINLNINMQAPIAQNSVIGEIEYSYNNIIIYTADLLAADEIKEATGPASTHEPAKKTANPDKTNENLTIYDYIPYAIILLIAVFVIFIIISIKRKTLKKSQNKRYLKTSQRRDDSRSGNTKRRRY